MNRSLNEPLPPPHPHRNSKTKIHCIHFSVRTTTTKTPPWIFHRNSEKVSPLVSVRFLAKSSKRDRQTDKSSNLIDVVRFRIADPSSVVSPRTGKPARSQIPISNESRTVPPKSSTTRGIRGKLYCFSTERNACRILASRTRSEDRFASSSIHPTVETPTQLQQPSYAAHTSSSMKKLRDNAVSTTPTRRTPSVVSSDTRPSSANKNMTKSLSSQNLIHPLSSSHVTALGLSFPRAKLPRRPPNLPIASMNSSSSSNSSSPMKSLSKDDDDQMPKWAQDCFYRTVVLGLKPVLLQDRPSTPPPLKTSTSTCSIDSSDLSEITSELQSYSLAHQTKDPQVRRSVSIPDYQPFKQKITIESTTTNDHRLPILNQLVANLHKHLQELEDFYSTVMLIRASAESVRFP